MGTFLLWSDAPKWEYSTAPLTYADGLPLAPPSAGAGGHALYLNDKQVAAMLCARIATFNTSLPGGAAANLYPKLNT